MNDIVNLLVGKVETAVKGLTLRNQNYVTGRDLLSERFSDNQALISVHTRRLLSFFIFFYPNF